MAWNKYRVFITAVFMLIGVLMFSDYALANSVIIEDEMDVLSYEEEETLRATMNELSAYGSVLFISIDSNTNSYMIASQRCWDYFQNGSAAVFCIDFNNRDLTIYVTGEMADRVSKSKCDIIADNVYGYASQGYYARAAIEAFTQVRMVYEGKNISSGMKIVGNICIALIIALMLNYMLAKALHGNKKMDNYAMLSDSGNNATILNASYRINNTSSYYSPPVWLIILRILVVLLGSGRGGSGHHSGSSGGGGGHGGGGHGGSHSF
ncbi:MAG: TPM domain-containing protein [Lachnospiraceae bacterium]|nr:TPM domain-containing protein [Lachnospiraceae bacterium]